jgi:HEAT repeat protein
MSWPAAQHRSWADRWGEPPLRVLILFLPAGLLLAGALRAEPPVQVLLAIGSGVTGLSGLVLIRRDRLWRPPVNLAVVGLYLIGLLWLTLGTADFGAWYPHLAQALFMLVPLLMFAAQMLDSSGLADLRRARLLGHRLAERKDWPEDITTCRSLPEVKALRESLHPEAAPALALLHHPRPQVRLAALVALEFRKTWRPGQSGMILHLAQQEPVTAVRAAAVAALANLDDRRLLEALVPFLYDRESAVRRAAAEALLWDAELRWPWLRLAIHAALSDPRSAKDGPLPFPGADLPAQAIADLTGWASETGSLGLRAALTLVDHYSRTLCEGATEPFIERLRAEVADPHVAAVLRLELARLLLDHARLTDALLERLLDLDQPAPLRLLAAEALLKAGPHPPAVQALREIARQPNREIAMACAALVQRALGVDMGLALNEPLPALNSRQAADVTRRVMLWATQPPREVPEALTPRPPGRAAGLQAWGSGVHSLSDPDPADPPSRRRPAGGG